MDRRRGEGGSAEGHGSPYRGMSDGELIVAMRRRDGRAFAEFFLRFEPLLLDQARRLRVQPAEREERVQDFLADVALALADREAPLPTAVRGYLVKGFARRVLNEARNRSRRERGYQVASLETSIDPPGPALHARQDERVDDEEEHAVLSACSEHSVRASAGVDWEDVGLSPALERLAAMLDEGLSGDERLLLIQVSNHVPLRTIARWRGVKRETLKVQLWRLRRRLWEAARRYADSLSVDDKRELDRFFRRTAKMGPRPPAGGPEESAA
jgi:DNA-directed RNA polymerase specialized sigma24 family protein